MGKMLGTFYFTCNESGIYSVSIYILETRTVRLNVCHYFHHELYAFISFIF